MLVRAVASAFSSRLETLPLFLLLLSSSLFHNLVWLRRGHAYVVRVRAYDEAVALDMRKNVTAAALPNGWKPERFGDPRPELLVILPEDRVLVSDVNLCQSLVHKLDTHPAKTFEHFCVRRARVRCVVD